MKPAPGLAWLAGCRGGQAGFSLTLPSLHAIPGLARSTTIIDKTGQPCEKGTMTLFAFFAFETFGCKQTPFSGFGRIECAFQREAAVVGALSRRLEETDSVLHGLREAVVVCVFEVAR